MQRLPPYRDPIFRWLGVLFSITLLGLGGLALWEGVASGYNSRRNFDFYIDGLGAQLWGAAWVALGLAPLCLFIPRPRVAAACAIALTTAFGAFLVGSFMAAG